MPTNIDFLLKLANHGAFENGEVETHFIELHKDDLFINPDDQLSNQQAYNAASIAVACVCERENNTTRESSPGNLVTQHFKHMNTFIFLESLNIS